MLTFFQRTLPIGRCHASNWKMNHWTRSVVLPNSSSAFMTGSKPHHFSFDHHHVLYTVTPALSCSLHPSALVVDQAEESFPERAREESRCDVGAIPPALPNPMERKKKHAYAMNIMRPNILRMYHGQSGGCSGGWPVTQKSIGRSEKEDASSICDY